MSKKRKHVNYKQGGNATSASFQNKAVEESPQEDRKTCQCGCGQEVKNRFISGHNLKEIIALRKIPYDTLVIWERELKDTDRLNAKIKEFANV